MSNFKNWIRHKINESGKFVRRPTISPDLVRSLQDAFSKSGTSIDNFLDQIRNALSTPEAAPAPQPQIAPAVAGGDVKSRILDLVKEVPGMPQYIPEIRAKIGLPKEQFDKALWDLVNSDVVFLMAHNHAAALDPAERDAMISDRDQTFGYVAMYNH